MKRFAGLTSTFLTGCILCVPGAVLGDTVNTGAAVSANLETLIKTNSCRECNLQGVNLNRAELAGADLQGADLSGAKLYLANLAGANLKNSNLQGAGLGGADLAGADLRGANLTATSLDGAYTVGTLFDDGAVEANRREIDIQGLVGSENSGDVRSIGEVETALEAARDPESAEMAELAVVSAKPSVDTKNEAEPEVADVAGNAPSPKPLQPEQDDTDVAAAAAEPQPPIAVVGADRSVVAATRSEDSSGGAVDQGGSATIVAEGTRAESAAESTEPVTGKAAPAPITDVKGVARERLLDTKKCYGCDLSGLDLSGLNLKNADLEKADLTGCDVSETDLRKANLKDARILNADLRNADLREADFYKADLSGSDLTGADIDGTIFEDTQLSGVVGLVRESIFIDNDDDR